MEEQKNDLKKRKPVTGVIILTAALVVVFAIMIVYFAAGKRPVPSEPIAVPEQTPVPASAPEPAPAGGPELPAHEVGPELPAVSDEQRGAPEPQDAKGFFQAGEDSYYKGDFDAAIAGFKKAVELDSKYADAYCEMGVSYMEKSDWDTAIAQLSKAIEIDPNHPKAQYAIAVSYARKPQPDVKAAREHFELSKKLGFVYPQWFEDFLKRLEAGERFPGQE